MVHHKVCRVSVNRRKFLVAAGLGGTAMVVAACSPGSTPSAPTSTTLPPTTTAAPQPPDWAKLRSQLAGKLVLPSDPDYATAKLAYNPLYDSNNPAAIAQCVKPEDVQACVAVAAASRIPIAARSGGHSYAGYSTPNQGLVVDLGGMTDVQVHPDGTAVVGAGARLFDVYSGVGNAGRCLPGGSCPTVGISGLTLGGGLGVLTRKYGLTCDRLVSVQIVTPDGMLRTASAQSEPDLYWALRGGGGGNFGIVTSFTFRTEAATELTTLVMNFPAGTVAPILGAWQQWAPAAPDELWTSLQISGDTAPSCKLVGCFVGTPAGLTPLLNDFLGRAGVQPTTRQVSGRGFLEAMEYFGGGCSDSAQCHPSWTGSGQFGREAFVASSHVMTQPINDPGQIRALMQGRTNMTLIMDSFGGAASRVSAADTAFPYRSALATIQIYQGTTAAGQQQATQAVGEVRDRLGELIGPAAYVNYIDPSQPNWASSYYGNNLDRLRQVAKKYDPNGMFAFAQSLTKA